MGAVLHTLNIRLFPEQLTYVDQPRAGQADPRRRLARSDARQGRGRAEDGRALRRDRRRRRVGAAVGGARTPRSSATTSCSRPSRPSTTWPEIDERQAAALCYTSGTTGNPKGVAYSHRSAYLHSLAATTPAALNLSERERILTIVPMFHANAWGIPYAAFMCGASLVMPGRFLQAEPLDAHGQGRARHVLGRGAHDLGRHPALRRRARDRPVVDPHDHLRRLGGAALADGAVRGAVRRAHRAGVGHDRDVAARRGRAPAGVGRARERRGDGLARPHRPGRVGRRAAHRRRHGQPAAVGRRSGRRDRGARAVDHRPTTSAIRRPRSSTTAGCAPATSARSTRSASCRSPTGPRT